MVMANCVRRSNAVNQYGKKLVYKEAQVFPGVMAGFISTLRTFVIGTAIVFPPLKALLKYCFPPGSGPSEESMKDSFLKLIAFGNGTHGTSINGMFYIPGDPGYKYTGKMLAESGMALAFQLNEVSSGGGVWTPACCIGDVVLARLKKIGIECYIN